MPVLPPIPGVNCGSEEFIDGLATEGLETIDDVRTMFDVAGVVIKEPAAAFLLFAIVVVVLGSSSVFKLMPLVSILVDGGRDVGALTSVDSAAGGLLLFEGIKEDGITDCNSDDNDSVSGGLELETDVEVAVTAVTLVVGCSYFAEEKEMEGRVF